MLLQFSHSNLWPMTRTRKPDPWLSLPEAARVVGRSRQTVVKMAAAGDLKHDTVAGRMVIDRASAVAAKKQLDKDARPDGRRAAG